MSCHNAPSKKARWIKVKARIIGRYGSVRGLAHLLGVHFNSIRLAAEGTKCPRVTAMLREKKLL